jgi:hypothetical protein
MKKLIIDFTSRLIKGKALWISIILSELMVLYAFLEPLSMGIGESLLDHFDEWSTLSLLCAFIPVCAYTTAALFSKNTIQEIIEKGYSQRQIYSAKTLVNLIFSTVVFFINILTVYLLLNFLGSFGNEVLLINIPSKLLMTIPVCLFYSVLFTDLSFVIKRPVISILASWLTLTVVIKYLITSLSQLTGTIYDDVNFLSFFNNSFFETAYFMDNVNAYILPVSGIYLVLTVIVYIIGVQGFSKAQLKLIKE